ncbi:aryl-alcohol dehydrogenase-like predicted oxidoreductase [Stackebrandtia albiflava]|uniref:Aryl-alcohol dehydrogenase-like predicted oxidoreductase n=1 Tax=Stackebrandtia albiflava TaxID=406432 RepID=A0A562VE57_9ACTN|nr:aldo/keto reductase [Stackebrandtia albiflava]TWJ16152.1 aryl-alcohol dehydrogenase-like predicted oxidoreductase [Stackebrandtia albiflava]
MEYRRIGRTGLRVSELCLGAMYFGGDTDEKTAFEILDRFVEAGGNFIDTANRYNDGESESLLGRWLKNRDRDRMVVATKVFGRMHDHPNGLGLSRKHIVSAVEDSLRRLDTDYIDLYYTHVFSRDTPLEETLSTLDTLVTAGKVRYLGASNLAGWQLQKAVDLSTHHGWNRYVALQPLYNLLDRDIEWDSVEVCLAEGLGVMPWSPLRAGWLSGRFTRGMQAPPESARVRQSSDVPFDMSWEQYNTAHTWQVLDALEAVAAETGRSVPQVATRWLIQKPGVTAPIIGPRTLAHAESSLGAAGWTLSAEQMSTLDAASAKPKPYPFNLLEFYAANPG